MDGPLPKSCIDQLPLIPSCFLTLFLSLGMQELETAMLEKELVLCSALKVEGSHCHQTKGRA